MRGVRGGWFVDDAIELLWTNDVLCYVSNDEGAKIVVIEVFESAAVTERRPAERREARAMAIQNITCAA